MRTVKIEKHFRKYGALYVMLLIPFATLILFKYIPMYGIQIAFKNYRITRPMEACDWVGLKYFRKFFEYYDCWPIIRNTLLINLYSLALFPLPLIFALMLNYLPFNGLKKTIQNVSYIPHFLSTVVLCTMVIQFCNARTGLINSFLGLFGVRPVNYMARKEYYYSIYVWSDIWKDLGYSSIIYIAALSGVSSEQHEAAIVDGANIIKRIWHVDLPAIMPTFCTLLIMRCGTLLSLGFEKTLLLQNTLNTSVSEVISTFTYNISLNASNPQFSYATAIGLLSSGVNMIILLIVNKVVGRLGNTSIW